MTMKIKHNIKRNAGHATCPDCKKQAEDFLTTHGIKFRATLSDSKVIPYGCGVSGHHYRVTLSKSAGQPGTSASAGKRITFDIWASLYDMQKGVGTVTPYDVFSNISSDVGTPETFREFCSEHGYGQDLITSLQTFRRRSSFSKRLRAFFTQGEIADLQRIQ